MKCVNLVMELLLSLTEQEGSSEMLFVVCIGESPVVIACLVSRYCVNSCKVGLIVDVLKLSSFSGNRR